MRAYVLAFHEIDQTQVAAVGGKGAGLGELSRIEGVSVPDGFCVTTEAFAQIISAKPKVGDPSIHELIDQLSHVNVDDVNAIGRLSAEIRQNIEATAIPLDVADAISSSLIRLGEHAAYAVRSSATAEDLPTASFAGQQDTYLNVVGQAEILDCVRRCWASLFTERAVIYRMRNSFDHRRVQMAVVVQRMVLSEAAGILFTADPISGNRKVSSIDASFGLGEALVSGRVNPDVYKVRDGAISIKTIGTKTLAIHPSADGGTHEALLTRELQTTPALSDDQILQLSALGRRIEAHFGRPQDIEWCLANGKFQVVQSRPITTLFPIPEVTDRENHVYLSVGHNQMMTDAFKPLGLSFWQMETPKPMAEAGGRLFVDVTAALTSPSGRTAMLDMMGKSDPLFRDALQNVLDRPGFIRLATTDKLVAASAPNTSAEATKAPAPTRPPAAPAVPIEIDSAIVSELIANSEASVAKLKHDIQGKTGTDLFDFIVNDIQELRRILFDPKSHGVFMTAIEATWWLNDHLYEWLGEKNAADTLAQSVDNNVTSEMGLALLDVADAIRPHPDAITFLERASSRDLPTELFLHELAKRAGGLEARNALQNWLDKYGMRAVGEIDITRPRWGEQLATLIPLLISNIKNSEAGEAKRRFEQGSVHATQKEREILERLRALPDGEQKAIETKTNIDRVRTFIGYREYPKYGKTSRDFVYKKALMKEAERLVNGGVIREAEDIFYLRFEELKEVVRTGHADAQLIRDRKAEFKTHEGLRPPRVLTSEGECINGSYNRDNVPNGALVGLAVSAGTIEGRARVILDMAKANLEPGDILITAYTDPSWTPLFVAIKGLVTEVGGLMTHGAVIAREYGLPAVVGVENATTRIRDGQRIRLNGTEGWVEVLG